MVVEFHSLRVKVRPETDDSVCITFEVPEDLREHFGHIPGQHLVLRTELDGEDVRRSYSICTSPSDQALRVGVKRLPGGLFSTHATTALHDGDRLDVMAPIGEFTHQPRPETAAKYVALVAGAGITPVLSILTAILEVETASECTLVYGNRTSASVMFLEELESLKNKHHERFRIIHVLSREPNEVPLFQGRIDAAKIRLLADSLIDVGAVDKWFMCGPLDMVETATDTLRDLGVSNERLHSELFFDERIEAVPDSAPDVDGMVTFTFTLDGRTSVLPVDPSGPSLLDYARSVRGEVPFSCKGGMCATCKAYVLDGEVSMVKNFALTPEETADGLILSCQAHPVDGDVVVTYDLRSAVSR